MVVLGDDCEAFLPQLLFGWSVSNLSNLQVLSDLRPTIIQLETCCVVTIFLSLLETQVVMPVRLVRDLQLVHHPHEDDAVGIRLWNAFLADVVRESTIRAV